MRKSYVEDESLLRLMDYITNPSSQALKSLTPEYRSKTYRYTVHDGKLYYSVVNGDTPRVVIPTHNNLRLRIMYECHDAPTGGIVVKKRLTLRLVVTSTGSYW